MDGIYIDLSQRVSFKSYTKEQIQIIINILSISVGFMLLQAAYSSMEHLQTSINAEGGLGNMSLFLVYGAESISKIFLPTLVIRYFGTRYTLTLCMLCYSLYIAMQFYPTVYTLGPTAVILGLAAAPLLIGKASYMSIYGRKLAELLEMDPNVVLTRIFSMKAVIIHVGLIIGNLISSAVLSTSKPLKDTNYENMTCGVHFCPVEEAKKFSAIRPEEAKIYILTTIYLISSLLASVCILLFLNPVENFSPEMSSSCSKDDLVKILFATLYSCRNVKVLLLIPHAFIHGSSAAFIMTEYNQAFIGCSIGIANIGYAMTSLAVAGLLGMVFVSFVVHFIDRLVLISAANFVQLATLVTLLNWEPSPDHYLLFFAVPFLWGFSAAVMGNQMTAMNGIIFAGQETSSFSAVHILGSPGVFFTFLTSTYFCMRFKIWYLLIGSVVGLIGYYIVEHLVRNTETDQERMLLHESEIKPL